MDVLKLSPKELAFLGLLVGNPIMDKLNHQDTAESAAAVSSAYNVQVNGALDAMQRDVRNISDDVHNLRRACGIAE